MAGMPSVSAKDFFTALWFSAPEGYVELHLIRPNTTPDHPTDANQQWFYPWPAQFDKFLAQAVASGKDWNTYFGVGLRSRMRGKDVDVSAITALHCDIDFKKTPQAEAIKKLKEFPVKASAGNLTGGGLHVYWFLKEAATGDDLQKIRQINKAIAVTLGGDLAACTLKQLLRIPGSTNIKYDSKPEVKVAVWRPDLRHALLDFDFLPQEEEKKRENTKCPVSLPEGATYVDGQGGRPGDEFNKKATWDDVLLPHEWKVSHKSGKEVFWIRPGKTAGHSATTGYCGDLLYVFSSNAEPFEANTAYTKFAAYAMLNHGGDFSAAAGTLSRAGYGEKKADGKKDSEPDFEIAKIIKFDSRPAIWEVRMKHTSGRELVTKVETQKGFFYYRDFQPACCEQNDLILVDISQTRWQKMVNEAMKTKEVREAPKEARVDGAIEEVLNQFIADRKGNPQLGELKSFPGYDDHGMFFKLGTFKGFLRSDGVRPTERDLCQTLRTLGWEPESRRMGESVVRLWKKSSLNGSGHKPVALFTPIEEQKEFAP